MMVLHSSDFKYKALVRQRSIGVIEVNRIIDWCFNHIGPRYNYKNSDKNHSIYGKWRLFANHENWEFCFINNEDCVYFKLTWGLE